MRRAVVGVGAEPRVDAAGFALQFLDALGFFGAQGGLGFVGAVCAVGLTMALEQGLHGGFQLVSLVDEVGPGAAALFACVGGQLDTVDGEHLAADQALRVAHEQHLLEDLADQVTEAADEGGDEGGGEVGAAVAAQGDEDDVVTVLSTSEALDAPAGNHTASGCQQSGPTAPF